MLAAGKYVRSRSRRARRGRARAASARTAPRTSPPRPSAAATGFVGLHRPAAEPQGQGGAPATCAGSTRWPATRRSSSSARHGDAGDRGARRGQRRGGGREERRRAGRAARVHRALPGARGRADDDAAARRGPAGEPPLVRAARRAGRARTACEQLSMGTTQDFAVAVEEGATIVRDRHAALHA